MNCSRPEVPGTGRRWRPFVSCLVLVLASAAGFQCGAQGTPAPEPTADESVVECPSLPELMPGLYALIDQPQSPLVPVRDALRAVAERDPDAGPGDLAQLASSAVRGLRSFSRDPKERSDGSCRVVDPSLQFVEYPLCTVEAGPDEDCDNRLCALRRGLAGPVRDDGLRSKLRALSPILSKLLGYLSNTGPAADGREHFEVTGKLREMSDPKRGSICHPRNLVGLIDDTLVYFRRDQRCPDCPAERLREVARAIGDDGSLKDFLSTFETGQQGDPRGRGAIIKLSRIVANTLVSLPRDDTYFDPLRAVIDDLVLRFMDRNPERFGTLAQGVRRLTTLLQAYLDPRRPDGPVLVELQAVVQCFLEADPDGEVVGALYDLLSRPSEGDRGIDLKEFARLLGDLEASDQPGVGTRAIHAVLASLRTDEPTLDLLQSVTYSALSDDNVRRMVPLLRELVSRDVLLELLDLADNLFYGCRARPE